MTQAKFLHGSIIKHVITMSATNALGLSALFMVDLADIYFISLLGNSALTAAVGYASAVLFFTTSICIGLVTVNSASVAKSIGEHNQQQARKQVSHISFYAFIFSTFVALLLYWFTPEILSQIGAQGEELREATLYLRIILPSSPILALAMQMGATLRSLGDAKHAMYATVGGSLINALLDPLLIFVFEMDLKGAAIASVAARCTVLAIGFYFVFFKYKMFARLQSANFWQDTKAITAIAFPAIATQIATPLGNLYVTYEVAKFGSEYIAGWAIIGRLIPVMFAVMFALSGALGPIIGQNYGALQFSRVKEVLNQSIKFIISYTLVISLLLSMGQNVVVDLFGAENKTAEIIRVFCQYISITFIFTGITFVAMAFLNNLGYAKYATLLNIGKMTLGTVPFVTLGAYYYQAPGILYGQAAGTIFFGVIALLLTRKIINICQQELAGKAIKLQLIDRRE
ncbi:MAG: putative MATE family efflux protein [Psychromonas sp.]|jgi:putative MATE family efflux protein|uniref:MATE family efflux transporter n=1 Tax=Psychromonas sp. TaxID=1884585 RepID=UPI0039E50613